LSVKKEIQIEVVLNDALLQTRDINSLTAKEKSRLQKEQRYLAEFEKMKQAAQEVSLRNEENRKRMMD
jgi:hypothetical protein